MTWWHDLQGGKIAEQRPPPPGADEPYPNLASVPPKPAEPDRAALTNISNALIADRMNAQRVAAATPLADPSSPSASPALFGRGTLPPPPPAPPPGQANATASLPAATPSSPPAAPTPEGTAPAPSKAPIGAVQSTPLAPPGAAAQPTVEAGPMPPLPAAPPAPANLGPSSPVAAPPPPAPPPPAIAAAPPPAAPTPPAVAAAPLPVETPAAPPPAPTIAAAPAPAAPTVPLPAASPPTPAPAAMASVTSAPPPPANPTNTLSLTFITGSAALPPSATAELKQLAARRGSGIIAVTGYGDAASNDPDAQSTALTLGLSRAKAIAATLTSAGVPPSAVQVAAEAIGRGATARLVQ